MPAMFPDSTASAPHSRHPARQHQLCAGILAASLLLLLPACKFLPQNTERPAKSASTTPLAGLKTATVSMPAGSGGKTARIAGKSKPGSAENPAKAIPGLEPPWLLSQAPAQLQPMVAEPAAPGAPSPLPGNRLALLASPPLPAAAPANTATIAAEPPPIPAAPGESANPPPGFLLPAELFGKPPLPKPATPAPAASTETASSTATAANADSPAAAGPNTLDGSAAKLATSAADKPQSATSGGVAGDSKPGSDNASAKAASVAEAGAAAGGSAGANAAAALVKTLPAWNEATLTTSAATPEKSAAKPATIAATTAVAHTAAKTASATPGAGIGDDITRKLVSTKLPPVYIYASPTSRTYLAAGGINYQNNLDIWQVLLKRLDIPFEVIETLATFDKSGFKAANALVILPSAVALSESERRTLGRFHEQGGALLASWLCGVRNERGDWLGFQFMENVLGTKVLGSTEPDNDDSFLIPYGNSPVSHQLPSGLRVWTERVPNWYPLRLAGSHVAAQIMDWSRTVKHDKPAGLITWEQRATGNGNARSVVIGYPERLWFSADQKAFDALAGDALFWLLRQPAVYLSSWPYPYRSAFVLSINASDFTEEADDAFARQTETIGWHGTYYVLSERADIGKPLLTKLQQRGHEIGYFGDKLVGFQNQSANQQKKRIDTMINELKELEIEPSVPPGFRAPLEAYDATTVRLLRAKGISHIVTDQGASETRLPLISPGPVAANGEQLVLLPRTLSGPEDLFSDNKPDQAIRHFLAEMDIADEMGALGVVSLPTRSSLSSQQWGEILARLKARDKQLWLTTANQVSSWWREHERVNVSLNADVTPALLTVEITGDAPLQQAMTLLVNLPQSGRMPRLFANGHNAPAPKIAGFDALRAALILPNLAPGKYEWYLSFTAP